MIVTRRLPRGRSRALLGGGPLPKTRRPNTPPSLVRGPKANRERCRRRRYSSPQRTRRTKRPPRLPRGLRARARGPNPTKKRSRRRRRRRPTRSCRPRALVAREEVAGVEAHPAVARRPLVVARNGGRPQLLRSRRQQLRLPFRRSAYPLSPSRAPTDALWTERLRP